MMCRKHDVCLPCSGVDLIFEFSDFPRGPLAQVLGLGVPRPPARCQELVYRLNVDQGEDLDPERLAQVTETKETPNFNHQQDPRDLRHVRT